MASTSRKHDDYTVGWVCALPKEQTAAIAMLDERHENLPKPPNDSNAYTLGSIGRHNIVIACLPKGKIGTSSAAAVASRMVSTFPAIRFGLMIGIGGGVPPKVRLGDVVVGVPTGQHPGVVQWDMGKAETGGQFRRTGALNNPPTSLLTALTQLDTKQEMEGSKISELVEGIGTKYPRLASKYVRSDLHKDNLFKANCTHVSENAEGLGLDDGDYVEEDEEELDSEEEDCHLCDFTKTVKRKQRDMKVHHGTIASGNQVVKDAAFRDQLSKDLGGIMCIEMEAAGLPDSFPCIVVRGICDYADSHKNKIWQEHAAAVAAAYAKELLECVQPFEVAQEQTAQQQLGEKVDKLADGVQEVQQHLLSEEDRRILDWLSPLDYGPRHSDHLQQREEGTGNWFLESNKYLKWLETQQETLFCPGIPGAGKTILSSIVINDIETRSDDTVGISYIYLDYRHRDDQTVTKLLCCIAKQLGRTRPLPQDLRSTYEHHKSKNTNPNLVEIKSVVNSLVALYARVYIVVDAVDEYQECHGGRSDFLSEIFDLQAKHRTNIFATSRFIPEIVTKFDDNDILEIRAKGDDVQRYLRRHINHLPSVVQQDSKLQTEVIVTISEVIDGMFLLAQIYLESLRDKLTRRAMLTALSEMRDLQKETRKSGQEGSQGALAQAYKGVVDRVQSQMDGMRDLAIRALSWITFAKRPLSPRELQYALGVEPYQLEFDEDNLPPIQDVLAVCCGLVTLDKESDAIRLVHYTTQEYLESRPQEFFLDVHSFLTIICTTYLSSHTFEEDEFVADYPPLYEYAACHWGHHAIHTLCCDYTEHFLKKPKSVQSSFCTLWESKWDGRFGRFDNYLATGFFQGTMTGLQLAAYFGLIGAVNILLESYDVDFTDGKGSGTPLWWAALQGHKDVVELLIQKGANIYGDPNCEHEAYENSYFFGKSTPLWLAAYHGYIDIIELLVINGASPEIGLEGWPPIIVASGEGQHQAVELLLQMGVDVNTQDAGGATPLTISSMMGNTATINLLIRKGANLEIESNYWTAMAVAILKGYRDIAKVLIRNGAKVWYDTTPSVSDDEEEHTDDVGILIESSVGTVTGGTIS